MNTRSATGGASTGSPAARIALLTVFAMLAFAANSLLCRLALSTTAIDAASFTLVRIVAGAGVLGLIAALRGSAATRRGNWLSAIALFAYAAAFSFAYLGLPAATGALLLFGAVQVTMIGYGLSSGERLGPAQAAGLVIAVLGLVGLLLPGLQAPPPGAALLMIAAGIAWGVYSLRGRGSTDATGDTAGNFLRAVVPAIVLAWLFTDSAGTSLTGIAYAAASGALASGVGYAVWYTALPGLTASAAATVQLSVPALAAAGGVVFLGEPMSLRLWVASVAILGGVAVFIRAGRPAVRPGGEKNAGKDAG